MDCFSLANHWWFTKFANLSPRQVFLLYGIPFQILLLNCFLTFCSNGQSLLLFKFNIFVINTIVVASNNQMPVAENKANSYQVPVHQKQWKPPQTQQLYAWQFKYAHTVPTILCTSNGIICSYITLAFTSAYKQKNSHILCHVKFIAIHQNFTNTILFIICQLYDHYICHQYFTPFAIS